MGVCNCSMFCCTLLYVHSSIAIILMGKRELIALLNLSSWCLVVVQRLFLAVPRGCLQFVIVVFPDHTHLLFINLKLCIYAILKESWGTFMRILWNLDQWFRRCCLKKKFTDGQRTKTNHNSSPLAFGSGELIKRNLHLWVVYRIILQSACTYAESIVSLIICRCRSWDWCGILSFLDLFD